MLIAEKSIACRTRWATSSMIPNASCASTSKGIRSSSRASVISSMTRMDSLPRSTKAWAKWWDTKRECWRCGGIRTRRLRLSSRPKGRTGWSLPTMPRGVVSASSPVNTPTGSGTAMCRCTSGTPAGNGRTTAGNTTSLTSRPGSLWKRASC